MENPSNSAPPVQTVELKIMPSQIALAALTLVAVFGAVLLVLRLIDVLIVLFVALVIAATLRPILSALQRQGLPKPLALLLIYLGILGVLAGLFVLVIPPLVNQFGALVQALPQLYAGLMTSLEQNQNEPVRALLQQLPSRDQLGNQLQTMNGVVLSGVLGIGMGALALLAQILSTVVLSIYLTLDQSRLERFWLALVPAARRPALLTIWREIENRLGGYVRGELLLMTSIGVLASLGYLVMGLPYPLALGVFAGLVEFVPMVGPTLGAIPAVLVALTISPHTAAAVLVYSIVIQATENNLLVPRLMAHSVGVSPITVILAVFAFSSLLGIPGAFLAIPLAAIVQVLMDHLVLNVDTGRAEEPGEGSSIIWTMRSTIRQLRAETLQRLRTRGGRISLAEGDRDAVDNQVDTLLSKADKTLTEATQKADADPVEVLTTVVTEVGQTLTEAAQTADTETAEVLAAIVTEVDELVNQAGEVSEEGNAAAPEDQNARKDKPSLGIDPALV